MSERDDRMRRRMERLRARKPAEPEKDAEGTADSYMPTEDVTNAAPASGEGAEPNLADSDPYTLTRFQSQAAAKERPLAEGFEPGGRRLKLFEISERKAVAGEQVRWEIRDVETDEVVQEGGPLLLDHPAHSDFALTDARARAYAALRDLCDSKYRDLRGSKRMAEDIVRKKALLERQTRGLKLTAAQKAVVADIESQIASLSDEFITSVGGILRQEWDPGSSWELVEAGGSAKIVRKLTKLDDEAPTKHAFRAGQPLRVDSGILPEDVIVRECLGDRRYRVQSMFTHAVFEVDEGDLYDPSVEGNIFDGEPTIGIGDIANMF